MAELADSLDRAFDRIRDFEVVQAATPAGEWVAAVERLAQSVGLGPRSRAVLAVRLGGVRGGERAPGHVAFGVIVGLMAAELAAAEPQRLPADPLR